MNTLSLEVLWGYSRTGGHYHEEQCCSGSSFSVAAEGPGWASGAAHKT